MGEIVNHNSIPELTNEFVSKLIGKKVQIFSIKAGSAPGENYLSVLYCLKCVLASENENDVVSVVYGIIKCFPAHSAGQQFLRKSNIFWNELRVYKDLIPALKEMIAKSGIEMTLPFAPFISGISLNFGTGKENDEMIKNCNDKIFGPFDNFILMVDMKNTLEFRLADRLIGLGLEEMNLVMREYAKVHALSWAYKCKNRIDDLSVKFPFLKLDMTDEIIQIFMNMMAASLQSAYDILSESGKLTPEESGILDGLSKTKARIRQIIECIYFHGEFGSKLEALLRVPLTSTDAESKADDVPWKVVVHRDCWINNMLFRYDPLTKIAVDLVIIDLQLMAETCPTSDLAFVVYSNTSPELRRKHLKHWLHLYSDQFTFHCDALGVPYLPGFSFESLLRRFHRSKVFGFTSAMAFLPIMLKDSTQAQDVHSCNGDMDFGETLISGLGPRHNVVYKQSLHALCKEMYEDGVL